MKTPDNRSQLRRKAVLTAIGFLALNCVTLAPAYGEETATQPPVVAADELPTTEPQSEPELTDPELVDPESVSELPPPIYETAEAPIAPPLPGTSRVPNASSATQDALPPETQDAAPNAAIPRPTAAWSNTRYSRRSRRTSSTPQNESSTPQQNVTSRSAQKNPVSALKSTELPAPPYPVPNQDPVLPAPVDIESRYLDTPSKVIKVAETQIGVPYRLTSESATIDEPDPHFDCSSFTRWVFGQFGVSLPRTAAAQAAFLNSQGKQVSKAERSTADLMFSSSSSRAVTGHVGIYIGDEQMIDASTASSTRPDGVAERSSNYRDDWKYYRVLP